MISSTSAFSLWRYLMVIGIGLVLWPLVFVAGLQYVMGADATADWIASLYASKETAAEKVVGPRLLLVGGSNVLFGLSSRVLQEATGRETINLGTHAGLGLRYILDRAEPIVGNGDIAIVSPEYQLLNTSEAFPGTVVSLIATHDPEYVLQVAPWEAAGLLLRIPYLSLVGHAYDASLGYIEKGYDARELTASGDATTNATDEPPSSERRATILNGVSFATVFEENGPGWQAMLKFRDEIEAKGARVLITWPAHIDAPELNTLPYTKFFAALEEAAARAGIETTGHPKDYFLPISEMFDTPYHPNSLGRDRRSQLVALRLCALILCNPSPPAALSAD